VAHAAAYTGLRNLRDFPAVRSLTKKRWTIRKVMALSVFGRCNWRRQGDLVAGTTQVHDDMTGKTLGSAENPGLWGWRRVHGVRRVRRERHQRDCVACRVCGPSASPPRETVDNWCSDASFIQKSLKQIESTRNIFKVALMVENPPFHLARTEKRR